MPDKNLTHDFWKCTWSPHIFDVLSPRESFDRKMRKLRVMRENFPLRFFILTHAQMLRHDLVIKITRHLIMASWSVRTTKMKIVKIFELNFPISRSTASSFEWTFVELTKKRKRQKIFQFQSQVEKKKKIFYFYLFSPLKILFRAILS